MLQIEQKSSERIKKSKQTIFYPECFDFFGTTSTHPLTIRPHPLIPYLCNNTTRPIWLLPTVGSRGLSPWLWHREHSSR